MSWNTIIGLFAAFCTTVAFLPQALKVLKTKDTQSISFWMYLLFNTGVFLWFIYGFMIHSFPVILANAITLLLGSWILILKLRYG